MKTQMEEIFECLKEKNLLENSKKENLMGGGIKKIIESVNENFISELKKMDLPKDIEKYVKTFEYDEKKALKCMDNNIKKCKELAKAFSKVKDKHFGLDKAEKRLSNLVTFFEITKNQIKIDKKAKGKGKEKSNTFEVGILECVQNFIDVKLESYDDMHNFTKIILALNELYNFLGKEYNKRTDKKSDSKQILKNISNNAFCLYGDLNAVLRNGEKIYETLPNDVKNFYDSLDAAINFKDKKPLLRKLSPDSTPVLAYGSVKEAFKKLKDTIKKTGLTEKNAKKIVEEKKKAKK